MGIQITTAPASAAEWTLITTNNPSGAATTTFASIPAYNAYKIVMRIYGSSSGATLRMTLNAQTGANYCNVNIASGVIANETATGYVTVGMATSVHNNFYEIYLNGLGIANSRITFAVLCPIGDTADVCVLGGRCDLPSGEQLTDIKFAASAGNITGTLLLYGRKDV